MSVISELLKIERRSRAMRDINDNMFKIRAKGGISVTQINRFLGEADDVDGMAPVTLNNFSTLHTINKTERIDELDWSEEYVDDVILCGVCSDDNNAIFKDTILKDSVDEVIARISILKSENHIIESESDNLFESILLGNDLLQLARRIFYEGQVRKTLNDYLPCLVFSFLI